MKTRQLRGVRIWNLVPASSGFGEYECNGAAFVRKDSIKPNPKLDGLIRNQTGPAVEAETEDGIPVIGMMGDMKRNWGARPNRKHA
jgi:hypothetical protein